MYKFGGNYEYRKTDVHFYLYCVLAVNSIALVRAEFGLFHLLLYFEELAIDLKYHDQDPYNNQLAAVQSQDKQACISLIKPGSVVY